MQQPQQNAGETCRRDDGISGEAVAKRSSNRSVGVIALGVFCFYLLGVVSCGTSDRAIWERNFREGTKLLLDPHDWKDSEKHLQRALVIARKIGGLEGEQLESLTLPVLWNAKLRLEKRAEAETLLRYNVELDQRLKNHDDRDLAYPIGKLAGLLSEQSRYLEAKPLFTESLRIEQLNNSPKSFSIADLQLGLANVEVALGDSIRGDSLYRQALSIYKSARRPDTRYKKALESYHRFLQSSGRFAEAGAIKAEIDSVAQSIQILKRNRTKN